MPTMKYNALTNITVKNTKPKDKMYRLSDGGNLYLEVTPSGGKYWRVFYSFNGKRRQFALGVYPVLSLAEAREESLAVKKLIAKGIDPVANRKQDKLDVELQYENNFEAIAREWHKLKLNTWKAKHAANILKRMETHVFPTLGKKPITDIKPVELLHVLKPVEKSGKHELAHRILQTSSQIFRYAVACGKSDRDITIDLKGALAPAKSSNYARLNEDQLPEFIAKLNRYDIEYNGNPITKWGFQLLMLTFVRTGELRAARWDEIDFDKAQWRIPAERMKMKDQHIVPLTDQCIKILRKIQEVTGDSFSGYIFPSFANPRKTISDGTFLKVIKILGYKGITTGHGFRATASTILNENGFRADVIERQLAHAERNQIRAAYNHAEYLADRKDMMVWWSNYLESKGMEV